jgi:hypothetical protein
MFGNILSENSLDYIEGVGVMYSKVVASVSEEPLPPCSR